MGRTGESGASVASGVLGSVEAWRNIVPVGVPVILACMLKPRTWFSCIGWLKKLVFMG